MEAVNDQQTNGRITTGTSYGKGWDIMWKTFIELLVVSLVYGIISIPVATLKWEVEEFKPILILLVMFGVAYGVLLTGPIGYSVKWVYLKAVRREKIEIKDMFSVFERNYWNAVLANLAVGVIVGIGVVMLIVPGIIFACRLAFVPYLVIDRNMEAMEALKTSWSMTRGHGWTIFFMGLLAIPVVIAGLIMLFFGVILSSIWISVSFAVIYYMVSKKTPELLAETN